MDFLTRVHTLTDRILDAETFAYGELYDACNGMYTTLVEITETDANSDANRKDIKLESGNALGPIWAAMCITDLMRTKRYLDGILKATEDAVNSKKDKPVHILYAGTIYFT